jgi:hypothetical protein
MRGRKPKLTVADVEEIKRMYAVKDKPWSIPAIAKAFSISQATVNKAINGKASTVDGKTIDVCTAGNPAVNGICGAADCVCAPKSLEDFWGPVVYSYSRAQAIEDGILVDLEKFSFRPHHNVRQEAGIIFPVAMTRTAYARMIQDEDEPLPPGQDISGRMWDVLYMFRLAARRSDGDRFLFRVSVTNWIERDGKRINRTKQETVTLKAICGPGDDAAPVITIMLPNED